MEHSRVRFALPLAALLLLAPSSILSGQACIGSASFGAGAARIGAGADFTDGAKGYGAQLAFGSPQGAFATASLSVVDYDDVDEGGTVVGISGGYAINLGASKRGSFCPMVGFDRQTGPNIDTGFGIIELSARAFSFGGSIGGVASSTPTVDFVPFVGGLYVTQKATADDGSSTATATEDYQLITIGAGFVVNQTLTIRPAITFPVGLDGSDPSYGIAFAFSFGSAPSAQSRVR